MTRANTVIRGKKKKRGRETGGVRQIKPGGGGFWNKKNQDLPNPSDQRVENLTREGGKVEVGRRYMKRLIRRERLSGVMLLQEKKTQ